MTMVEAAAYPSVAFTCACDESDSRITVASDVGASLAVLAAGRSGARATHAQLGRAGALELRAGHYALTRILCLLEQGRARVEAGSLLTAADRELYTAVG